MFNSRYTPTYHEAPSNTLSCSLLKSSRDAKLELLLELYNGRRLSVNVKMSDKKSDLENFINHSTFLKNLFIDGKAATRYIRYKFENGFLKWKPTVDNGSSFTVIDDTLGIEVGGEASEYHNSTLKVDFIWAHDSRHEVAQLITEVDQQFGLSDEDKLKIQTFCNISLPIKSILDIAKSGNHADALEFVCRSYDFQLKLQLLNYFAKETANTDATRRCCELVVNDKRFFQLPNQDEVLREVADLFMRDIDNEKFESLSDKFIEKVKNYTSAVRILFDCFIKVAMYDQALKCAEHLPKNSEDYSNAQHGLGMLLSEHSKKPELSEHERREMREAMLMHLLAAPKYEEEVDKIYAGLCADDTRNPAVNNVGLTVGTLFNTAEHIKRKNEEIKLLKEEVERLRKGSNS